MNPDDDAKMFDLAPVSLWIEDYSSVRALFEQWRRVGVTDVRAFLATNPDRVRQCAQRIRVLKVNRKTLSLFGARDLDHLMANLDQVLRDDTFNSNVEELAQLWDGRTSFSSHTVNYALTGERLDLPDATGGRYVPVVDPERQWAVPGGNVPRCRVNNNLPGTPAFCRSSSARRRCNALST